MTAATLTNVPRSASPTWQRFRDAFRRHPTAIIGGIVSFFWPIAIGFWLGRRAKERREDQIQKEVQRQLAEEQNKS